MEISESQIKPVVTRKSSQRISPKRRLAYVGIIYLTFLLLLIAIEVATRLTMQHISSLDLFVVTPQQKAQVAEAKQSGIFEGDPLLLWRLKPNLDHAVWDFTVLSTNSEHLRSRNSTDTIAFKKPGAIRVVCLGDSVTFGFRVPVVWPDKSAEYDPEWLPFSMLLEKQLKAANPGKEIDVINMAVPGYTSHQGLAWLRRDLSRLNPDLLVVSFGWNDASLSDVPDREAVKTSWPAFGTRWLVDHSQAFAHATRWLRSRQQIKKANTNQTSLRARARPRVSQEEYLGNLLAIEDLARQHGAAVVVMAAPYRDHSSEAPEADLMLQYRLALGGTMRQRKIPFLEIRELTEEAYPANEGWFGERIHPNHMGHRLIASELLKMIASSHVLGEVNVPPLIP
ncbi:MAG TPA: GDSL-type esterase/lipase family protein [Pyrinomonadaceae bacterium]|nr:GDSL-type esterase/lipase family protein [Pyrinomonadaceae bacterium]